jgi:hypothetical protein
MGEYDRTGVHPRIQPSDQEYAAVTRVAASSPAEQLADFEYDDTDELLEFDASFEGSG